MSDDDRQRICIARAYVDEMNVDPVDRRHKLRKSIQLCLDLPPIVIRTPVAHELLQLRQLHALRLIRDRLAIRPAGRRYASAKIDDLLLRNIDLEGPNCVVVGCQNKVRWQNAQDPRGC